MGGSWARWYTWPRERHSKTTNIQSCKTSNCSGNSPCKKGNTWLEKVRLSYWPKTIQKGKQRLWRPYSQRSKSYNCVQCSPIPKQFKLLWRHQGKISFFQIKNQDIELPGIPPNKYKAMVNKGRENKKITCNSSNTCEEPAIDLQGRVELTSELLSTTSRWH